MSIKGVTQEGFRLKFATREDVTKRRKLIPILYDEEPLPPELRPPGWRPNLRRWDLTLVLMVLRAIVSNDELPFQKRYDCAVELEDLLEKINSMGIPSVEWAKVGDVIIDDGTPAGS